MKLTRTTGVLIALTALLALTPGAHAVSERPDPVIAKLPQTELTVSAAASLTDVFPVIASAFNERYPNITITFNFAGSNALIEQLRAGAPVDVIATASESTMNTALLNQWVNRPLLFAKNSMVIATPKGNPAKVTKVKDLENPRVLTAVCAPAVPCGAATTQLFAKNNVTVNPVTKELDVRAVLGKVLADQVDAGLVYATDAKSVGNKVTTVNIPTSRNVTTTYPIASVRDAKNSKAAQAFVNYVRFSKSAQGILRAWGFAKPW